MSYWDNYLLFENNIIDTLNHTKYVGDFIHDKLSGRITLYLLVIGTFALIQEIYISIEMTFLQKQTYDELNIGRVDESLKLHRLLVSDDYHSREYLDEKSGIVIEEFESREKFFQKPVHVSDIFVNAMIKIAGKEALEKPIKYYIEFSPEDFMDEKRYEFGCNLHVLRLKLYHLLKDSEWYNEYCREHSVPDITISQNVLLYNKFNELLPITVDDVQLCFLKMESGDTIRCELII